MPTRSYTWACFISMVGRATGPREAIRWYRKAADQGNHDSQNLIGTLYVNGFGLPRDPEQASLWFRKARGG